MAKEGRRKWLDRIAKVDRTVERIADTPANLVGRGRPISDSAKRDLWEKGVDGVATSTGPGRAAGASAEEKGRPRLPRAALSSSGYVTPRGPSRSPGLPRPVAAPASRA